MKKTFALLFAAAALTLAGCSTARHPLKAESKAASSASAHDPSHNSPFTERLLDHLVGNWVLNGTIDGKEATHDLDADWVLNREYVRLHEVSRDRNTNGGPAYEAIVLISWDQRSNDYACQWLDSTGGGGLSCEAIAHGQPNGDTIPFVFKLAGGDAFHTTFVYDSGAGTWQWIMDGDIGGKLQPFARVKLTRR